MPYKDEPHQDMPALTASVPDSSAPCIPPPDCPDFAAQVLQEVAKVPAPWPAAAAKRGMKRPAAALKAVASAKAKAAEVSSNAWMAEHAEAINELPEAARATCKPKGEFNWRIHEGNAVIQVQMKTKA